MAELKIIAGTTNTQVKKAAEAGAKLLFTEMTRSLISQIATSMGNENALNEQLWADSLAQSLSDADAGGIKTFLYQELMKREKS